MLLNFQLLGSAHPQKGVSYHPRAVIPPKEGQPYQAFSKERAQGVLRRMHSPRMIFCGQW